jgi:hypothetical protein
LTYVAYAEVTRSIRLCATPSRDQHGGHVTLDASHKKVQGLKSSNLNIVIYLALRSFANRRFSPLSTISLALHMNVSLEAASET